MNMLPCFNLLHLPKYPQPPLVLVPPIPFPVTIPLNVLRKARLGEKILSFGLRKHIISICKGVFFGVGQKLIEKIGSFFPFLHRQDTSFHRQRMPNI